MQLAGGVAAAGIPWPGSICSKVFCRLYGKICTFVQSDGELLASLNATLTGDRQRRLPHIKRFRNPLAIA
jgi:hypothetical protein